MGSEDIRKESKLIIKDKVNKDIALNEGNMIFFDEVRVISIIKQSIWKIWAATYTDNIDINPVVLYVYGDYFGKRSIMNHKNHP